VAVATAEHEVDLGAASDVRELDGRTLGVGQVAVAPVAHGDQDRIEVEAFVGGAVLVALALPGLAIGLAPEDARVDEECQAVGEHLARDA